MSPGRARTHLDHVAVLDDGAQQLPVLRLILLLLQVGRVLWGRKRTGHRGSPGRFSAGTQGRRRRSIREGDTGKSQLLCG